MCRGRVAPADALDLKRKLELAFIWTDEKLVALGKIGLKKLKKNADERGETDLANRIAVMLAPKKAAAAAAAAAK